MTFWASLEPLHPGSQTNPERFRNTRNNLTTSAPDSAHVKLHYISRNKFRGGLQFHKFCTLWWSPHLYLVRSLYRWFYFYCHLESHRLLIRGKRKKEWKDLIDSYEKTGISSPETDRRWYHRFLKKSLFTFHLKSPVQLRCLILLRC